MDNEFFFVGILYTFVDGVIVIYMYIHRNLEFYVRMGKNSAVSYFFPCIISYVVLWTHITKCYLNVNFGTWGDIHGLSVTCISLTVCVKLSAACNCVKFYQPPKLIFKIWDIIVLLESKLQNDQFLLTCSIRLFTICVNSIVMILPFFMDFTWFQELYMHHDWIS